MDRQEITNVVIKSTAEVLEIDQGSVDNQTNVPGNKMFELAGLIVGRLGISMKYSDQGSTSVDEIINELCKNIY